MFWVGQILALGVEVSLLHIQILSSDIGFGAQRLLQAYLLTLYECRSNINKRIARIWIKAWVDRPSRSVAQHVFKPVQSRASITSTVTTFSCLSSCKALLYGCFILLLKLK